MAKDYKKEPRKTPPARALGSWLSFLTGLGIGLACTALTWFWFQQPAQTRAPAPPVVGMPDAPPPAPAVTQEPPPPPESPVTRPTFDFYTILPEIEVKIPDSELPAAAESAAPPTAEEPATAPAPATATGSYVLQVASFQSREAAEQSKAMLALQGVQAIIHQAGIDGQNRFRVHVGPYGDLGQAQQMRSRLDQLGFGAIVLKVGGG
ncbi:MAG: SPOR domain-containing protein [Gammaproteobacteria bacterium]|nr:SPOR domain-containing protein [Gammaproteobacteria bacterium]